jgi:hypothetical protein
MKLGGVTHRPYCYTNVYIYFCILDSIGGQNLLDEHCGSSVLLTLLLVSHLNAGVSCIQGDSLHAAAGFKRTFRSQYDMQIASV